MNLVRKVTIMNAEEMRRAIVRLSHEIVEANSGTTGLVLVVETVDVAALLNIQTLPHNPSLQQCCAHSQAARQIADLLQIIAIAV